MDADGCCRMAGVGGGQLVRLTPEGAIDHIVPLPVERPSRPAFGGKGDGHPLRHLDGVGLIAGSAAPQAQP